jgi:hypothetical protein
VGRSAHRPPRGGRRERPARASQRTRRRHQQGLAPRGRVRSLRPGGSRAEHAHAAGGQVVRRELHRGPGPVVARRDHAVRLPLRHVAGLPGGHPGGRGTRRRRHDRYPPAPGRRRVRGCPRGRLEGGGPPRSTRARGDGRARYAAGGSHARPGTRRGPQLRRPREPRGGHPGNHLDTGAGEPSRRGHAAHGRGARGVAGSLCEAHAAARRTDRHAGDPPGRCSVVRGGPRAVHPHGDARLARRRGRRGAAHPGRLPARADPWPGPAAQRPPGAPPRREPSRLRPAHGARGLARLDARRHRAHEAVRVQRGPHRALPQRPRLRGALRRARPVRDRRGQHRVARVHQHALRRPALPERLGGPGLAPGTARTTRRRRRGCVATTRTARSTTREPSASTGPPTSASAT